TACGYARRTAVSRGVAMITSPMQQGLRRIIRRLTDYRLLWLLIRLRSRGLLIFLVEVVIVRKKGSKGFYEKLHLVFIVAFLAGDQFPIAEGFVVKSLLHRTQFIDRLGVHENIVYILVHSHSPYF